jgi:HEAT repeat protein
LTEKLKSAIDAQVRAETACSIGRSHVVEAIPQLIAMLGDDTPIKLINCWENGRWSPAIKSLKQPSPGEQAAIALASMGLPSLKPLIDALSDSNSSVRRNAAWAIGELTNMAEGDRDDAVLPLVSLLRDSSDWVRVAAARALGEIRDERASDDLIALLSDGQSRVRETAAWALGEMKERRGVASLCNLVASDSEPEVRSTSAWALGEMKDKRAVETLCNALVTDQQPKVRSTAAWALGEIQSRKAVSFLNQALSDGDKSVRAKAIRALAEIEGQ